MAVRAYFSHDIKGCRKSDGSTYRAREILAVLYGYTGSRSEIIHWNSAGTADTTYKVGCNSNGSNCKGGKITVSKTVATAQRNFMNSSTHRAVELSTRYDRFGCGSAKAPDSARVYYACLFTVGGPTVLAKPKPTPAPTPTAKVTNASCSVNLRSKATTNATRKATISPGTTVRVVATVTAGGRYSTECGGRDVSGKSWFKIDRVNGKSVSSLYGVRALYGAAGLFRPGSSTTAALPPESIGAVGQTAADGGEVAEATPTPTPLPRPRRRPSPRPPRRRRRPPPTPTPTPSPSPTPTPSPTPLIAKVYTLTSSVTFHGRGYGHGVGLSQYGARGRAAAGQGYAAILAHYFKGTTLGNVANAQIRVLVLNDFVASSTRPLTIYGRTGTFTIDGISETFPKDARVRIYPTTSSGATWNVKVTSAGGTSLHSGPIAKSFRIRPAQTSTRLQLYSKPSSYDRYRGVFRIVASTKVDVINELPLETYLRGVVPAEMPSHWHAEALKAQTVAARSYAARRLRPGVSTFDVYDDTRSQVYQGVLREATSTNSAITATAGKVLKSGSSIANTFFHSTGGGATEHNENVFVSSSGAKSGGARELPSRLVRPGTRRHALRRVVAIHLVEDRDVHPVPALVMAGRRQPHERGKRREARPPQPRCLGTADQRDDHRLDRQEEDGLGGRLPVGDQRQAARRRPALPRQLLRADAGSLTPRPPSRPWSVRRSRSRRRPRSSTTLSAPRRHSRAARPVAGRRASRPTG